MNFYVDIKPVEHEDPARTKHVILKRPGASWSHSVYSVPLGGRIIPNRDYPYEGLSMMAGGASWHVLDGVAVGVRIEGDYVKLHPAGVSASPWRMIYRYEGAGVKLLVDYYLLDVKSEGASAVISIHADAQGKTGASISVEPIADIRHVYDASSPEDHWSKETGDGLLFGRDKISVFVGANTRNLTAKAHLRTIDWWYKMGSGYRNLDERGEPVFLGESRKPVSLGEIEIPSNSAVLAVSCGLSGKEAKELADITLKKYKKSEREEERRAQAVARALDAEGAVAFRAIAMTKFGMYHGRHFFHDAGDFWFRTPWMRDEFEGLLHNIDTLLRIGKGSTIKNIITSAFKFQSDAGVIPNRVPNDYNSADATLLAYILAGEYVERTGDVGLFGKISKNAKRTLEGFKRNSISTPGGPPVLHENGLLSIVPWHTWTDGMHTLDGHRVPIRLPEEWVRDLIRQGRAHELEEPRYLLPEINAQWILTLRAWEASGKGPRGCSEILSHATESFKRIFMGHDFLHNAVTIDGKKDPTPGSPAVVAMALVPDLFSKRELEGFVSVIKRNLMVKRKGLCFGIMTKKSEKTVYLGDGEYHEGVVWPRDTPYLIKLLRITGETDIIKELLESTLDHQMNEGFVFYSGELFSPDGGKMTPVKNPVQWWSGWTDPYISNC